MPRANLGRQAKIVATLGPASSDQDTIGRLITAGMNVARINMSHGDHAGHAALIDNIRQASRQVGLEVAILIDLQGPKIRVDELPEPLELRAGEIWVIGPARVKDAYPEYRDRFIPTVYEKLVDDCRDGHLVLFNDGAIVARAVARDREVYRLRIEVGGRLTSHKGINLPHSRISAPSFTAKDREDLLFGLEHGVDYVALSFVRQPDNVNEVREFMAARQHQLPIVAKIENPEGIDNIEAIIAVSEVIMIARGDMGVEVGNHLVPAIQKRIINLCNRSGVPVITATQMLESMINSPTPTRAEASDVANAVWDGTDALMLSAETAAGRYPLEAITMMSRIIHEAEKTPKKRPSIRTLDLSRVDDSIMLAASLVAEKVGARRILAVTESGRSCLKISHYRPRVSILGISYDLRTVRRLCLYWGVSPFLLRNYREDHPRLEEDVIEQVRQDCELEAGDRIVITRGSGSFFARGSSNSVKVKTLPG
ncbi:MAG: pyruvate kinase [Deltaproteobacteria bacterium]|nr:pyruvate kinase [Deltaproteobacteria bacterium]